MNKENYLKMIRAQGKAEAAELRAQAAANKISDTQIIDEEYKVPFWNPNKDYTDCPIGTPIRFEDQVYGLIIPHNASYYSDTPATNAALWGIKHTKNKDKAKPFKAPQGTSGMYMAGEYCKDEEGHIWKCVIDNNVYSPEEYPANWEKIS